MIYLASVYSIGTNRNSYKDIDLREKRYEYTMKRLHEFFAVKRLPVFSPIVHCHEMSKEYGLPKDYLFWQDFDRHMISVAKELWVLKMPHWELSRGITDEIRWARLTNTPITYIDCDDYEE
ncbi:protein of unknown function DUF1937 [Vibrio phage 1.262.O._10N.286.51.A9]|nr:protein of unknown function DUF1937 [Vibrio phage 1.262.O._10N.286.51.A9]